MSEAPVVVEYRQIRLGRSNASVDITNGLVVDNYRPEATTAVTLRVLFNGQELPAPLSEELGMVDENALKRYAWGQHGILEFPSEQDARREIDAIHKMGPCFSFHLVTPVEQSLLYRTGPSESVGREPPPECPICCEDSGVFALSICGHTICDKCLFRRADSGSMSKVTCPAGECRDPIALKDFVIAANRYTKGDKRELQGLSETLTLTALKNFLHRASSEWTECRNKACDDGIVNIEAYVPHDERNEAEELAPPEAGTCGSCWKTYCMRCGNAPHTSNCYENAIALQIARDPALREWHEEEKWSMRRFCPVPKCCASMEKLEGCNHMMCATCGTHFCWPCASFTASVPGELYAHLRSVHGHIGIEFNDFADDRVGARRRAAQLFYRARGTLDQLEAYQNFVEAVAVYTEGLGRIRHIEPDYFEPVPCEKVVTEEMYDREVYCQRRQ
ncbi:helicase [Aphelenchoides avenae]|nr:helicase [Aphelenchus avenae]